MRCSECIKMTLCYAYLSFRISNVKIWNQVIMTGWRWI
jgi:hypothetical protein